MKRPQQLPNGQFLTQLRDPVTGKRIPIRGDTEADCIARAQRARQNRRDIKMGWGGAEAHAQMRALGEGVFTVRRAWAEYVAAKDERARRQHQNAWENFFAPTFGDELPLSNLTAEVMTRWEREIAARGIHRVTTIGTMFACLRAAVRAHVPSRIHALPFGSWTPAGLGKPAGKARSHLSSIEELRAVLLAARRRDERLRLAWITKGFADLENRLTVAFLCGLRNGELGGLGWDDIRFDDDGRSGILTPRHQVVGNWNKDHPDWSRPMNAPKGNRRQKKGQPRAVKPQRLHPDACAALLSQRAMLEARGWYRADGPVFPRSDTGGWRTDEATIKPDLARACLRESGLEGIDVESFVTHSTRHTFASLETAAIVMAGGSLRDVAERTRHTDLRTLEVYLHPLGYGLVQPTLPRLGMPEVEELETVQAEPLSHVPPQLPPAPRVELVTRESGGAFERERQAAAIVADEQRYSKGGGRGWTELARAWIAAGKPGRRPAEVTHDFEKAYTRAYVAELRRSGDKEAAKAAGFRAKRASEGRFARIVKLLEGGGVTKTKGVGHGASAQSEANDRAQSGSVRGALGVR